MKSIKKLILVSGLLISTAPTAYGGDRVLNGGGLAERNITFAFQNIAKLVPLCEQTSLCNLTSSERALLNKIVRAMPEEYAASESLIFMSEKKNPGTFILDGAVKVAKTGSEVGSSIYFNTDLLYHRNKIGQYQSISIVDALSILIHELGHHHGEMDHAALDYLGSKVAVVLQRNVNEVKLSPFRDYASLTMINSIGLGSFPIVLLRVEDEMVDLSQKFKKAVKCSKGWLNIGIGSNGIRFGGSKAHGATFHNVHWEKAEREVINQWNNYDAADYDDVFIGVEEDQNQAPTYEYQARGNVSLICKKEEYTFNHDYKAQIDFKLVRKQNENGVYYLLDHDSIRVKQKKKALWKFFGISLGSN